MTKQQIKRRYRAWKQAKSESWKRAWEFADAVAEYAVEKPRGYGVDIAEETGLTSKYINQINRTAIAYARSSARNPEASFRAHMQFTIDGRGGEWVPDGTTLRDVTTPEKSFAKQLADAPMEEVEKIVAALPQERRTKIERAIVDTHPALASKTPIGVSESIRAMEANASFLALMGGPLARLSAAVDLVRSEWDRHEGTANDEQKEVVQQQINDAVATLLAINSDPQELLT